jgi:acyl-CoA dehydrogenase
MTEPAVASSDAKNIESRIESDGDHYVINGRKWWSSGMGDPRCKVIVFMGKSDPNAPPYRQQSMIVVPRDTPGIKIVKMLHVFGYDDAPHGHAEVIYDNVRVPKDHILLGEGRGFEIAQGRLGPGRIHHCMRAIGVAERALEMAIKRAKSRVAFGQRVSEMGVTKAHVADMRMEIDMARLLVLKAAWAMDKFGNKEARQQIAMIKVAVPNITSKVVDRCLQLHGAGGVSQVFKLASMYAHQRTLRLADGPDEVHRDQVGRMEIAKHN